MEVDPMRALSLAVMLLAVPSATYTASQQSADIAVKVVRSDVPQPLAGVDVVLTPISSGVVGLEPQRLNSIVQATDSRGEVLFSELATGRYRIEAQRGGFFGVASGRRLERTVAAFLTLSPGQWHQEVTLSLAPGGTISGRILGPNGEPVSDAEVSPLTTVYSYGVPILDAIQLPPLGIGRIGAAATASARTNSRGEYSLEGLPPGKYVIRSRPETSEANSSPPALDASYYPGVSSSSQAVAVTVLSGVVFTNLDFRLPERTPGVSVTGKVLVAPTIRATEDGCEDPLIYPRFYLVPRLRTGATEAPVRVPNAAPVVCDPTNGFPFEIRDVAPGSYDFYAVVADATDPQRVTATTRPTGHTLYSGRTVIDVRDTEVTNVSLQIRPGADLRGRVTVDDGKIPQEAMGRLDVELVPTDLIPSEAQPVSTSRTSLGVRADGTFQLTNVPDGRYRLVLGRLMPQGTFLTDVRQGGLSIYRDPTIDISGSDPIPVEFVLSRNGGTIRGTLPAQELSTDETIITLIPDASRRGNMMLYRTFTVLRDEFTLDNVPPGQYKVYAWKYLPEGAEFNLEFLRQYDRYGQTVTVSPRTVTDITVSQIPSPL